MEHVDVIIEHNIENNASMSRLPIFDATGLKTRPTGQRNTPKRLEIWLFQGGGEMDEID